MAVFFTVCIYVYTHTHIHICLCAFMCMCVCIYMCVCVYIYTHIMNMGFPGGSDGKESTCSIGTTSSPWVRKIPWRREWQPTPLLLLGEADEQKSLVGYRPWGRIELDRTERLSMHISMMNMIAHELRVQSCCCCYGTLRLFCKSWINRLRGS